MSEHPDIRMSGRLGVWTSRRPHVGRADVHPFFFSICAATAAAMEATVIAAISAVATHGPRHGSAVPADATAATPGGCGSLRAATVRDGAAGRGCSDDGDDELGDAEHRCCRERVQSLAQLALHRCVLEASLPLPLLE